MSITLPSPPDVADPVSEGDGCNVDANVIHDKHVNMVKETALQLGLHELNLHDHEDAICSKPLELFATKKLVKICAPMVRYSKLPFRMLVRKYGCDLAYTPMMMSDCFVRSSKARDSDFVYMHDDKPLIAQFAANNVKDFADATQLISPYVDGVGLNCGCPQRWALQDGLGACLIHKPQLVADIVKETRARLQDPEFTVSVKIRIKKDFRETVDFCQKMESAGASWIAVHGRTTDQRNQPVNLEVIRLVKENVSIPVVANGDIRSLQDAHRVQKETGVDGVMAARGMLDNPAMFAGYEVTPLDCLKDWVKISLELGTSFTTFHHHLMYMMEHITSRAEKRVFNGLNSTTAILDYLSQHYNI